jgi:hypothetical protein
MMSEKEGLIYTARLALRCAVAIVVVTVLFLLVAGFLRSRLSRPWQPS